MTDKLKQDAKDKLIGIAYVFNELLVMNRVGLAVAKVNGENLLVLVDADTGVKVTFDNRVKKQYKILLQNDRKQHPEGHMDE